MRSPRRLRKKLLAFRKRMRRKEWDDTDEETMSLLVGQPKEGE
jgi:hypothetical protein